MTETPQGAAGQRPPHAVALPQGRQASGKAGSAPPVEMHPSDIRQRVQYMERPRRRFPIIPALVAGALVVAVEMTAPFGFRPLTGIGNAYGALTTGRVAILNRQELCKQAAEAQLALDRNSAQQKYNLTMRRWNAEMDALSRRLANEKSSTAMYMGQCGFAALLGPEAAELCGGLVALRYAPSLQIIEQEINRIQQLRPEQPEVLKPTYRKHLEACEAA